MPWLENWARQGMTPDGALDAFDTLAAVTPEVLIGTWRGTELPSGHPLDGLLAFYGWHGKAFMDADRVHPLLFDGQDAVHALDPARLPLGVALRLPRVSRTEAARGLYRKMLPVLATRAPKARLRSVAHRGLVSAGMIYDDLPIIDHFRRVDDTRVLGLMDWRPTPAPFFFLLTREATGAAAVTPEAVPPAA
ncbi:DUF4334 domain-containing protein [Brevundimonas sp. R86498]|uniref:DUF4334 domain-containing protein n=1 Tax=Brevundimonas sp. R86498 TaxID=3093845 RepID=UPI0037C814E2